MDGTLRMLLFVVGLCIFIYAFVEIWNLVRSPKFKADIERLRENRRRRRAAKRRG
jgi:hypothetical protein